MRKLGKQTNNPIGFCWKLSCSGVMLIVSCRAYVTHLNALEETWLSFRHPHFYTLRNEAAAAAVHEGSSGSGEILSKGSQNYAGSRTLNQWNGFSLWTAKPRQLSLKADNTDIIIL